MHANSRQAIKKMLIQLLSLTEDEIAAHDVAKSPMLIRILSRHVITCFNNGGTEQLLNRLIGLPQKEIEEQRMEEHPSLQHVDRVKLAELLREAKERQENGISVNTFNKPSETAVTHYYNCDISEKA